MNCSLRLLWIYLNRGSESATSTRKRLDPLLRTFFNSGAALYPPETPLEPFIATLHFVMVRQVDYAEDFVKDFLKVMPGTGLPQLDRATALIKAVSYLLNSNSATWPESPDFVTFQLYGMEPSESPSLDVETRLDVTEFLHRFNPAISDLLVACDKVVNTLVLSNDTVVLSAHASSSSLDHAGDQITLKHGDVHITYPARFEPVLRLFHAVLNMLPRCLPSDVDFSQVAQILSRATFSADPGVCSAASAAMMRLAKDPANCLPIVNAYMRFVFDTRHIFRDTFIGSRLLESQFERIIVLWLNLVQALVSHQRNAEVQSTDYGDTPTPTVTDTNLIDQIEARAVFLLCSNSLALRKLAGQVLTAARDLESRCQRPSAAFRYSRVVPDEAAISRVLQLYEREWTDGDVRALRVQPWMTSSDRTRLDLATGRDRSKLTQRIAESDHPKDLILWASVFPFFIGRMAGQLPRATEETRLVVTMIVLRLQGHIASVASSASRGNYGARPPTGITRTSSDAGLLAEHWRSYLSVLCVTLPAVQPTPASPPIQRTKEAVILTPDTIHTPALLHYLTSLLAWEDPRFKDAAVYALGTITQPLLRPLSEVLLGVVRRLADGSKIGTNHRETSRRAAGHGGIWTAVAHVFRLISPLILDIKSSPHLANLSSMIGFVKVTYTMLSDPAVTEDYDLQSLRRSLCIVVDNLTTALGKLDSSARFFGDEFRGAIFKLCYEWCHIGRRPDVAKARESHLLQAAANAYRGDRDRAQYLDDLQAKTKLLSAAAADAMAGLCVSVVHMDSADPDSARKADHDIRGYSGEPRLDSSRGPIDCVAVDTRTFLVIQYRPS